METLAKMSKTSTRADKNNKAPQVLSEREREVLNLLAVGMTSKEIGEYLHVSHHTIDTHRRNMIHKLEVKNSIALINMGRCLGWI